MGCKVVSRPSKGRESMESPERQRRSPKKSPPKIPRKKPVSRIKHDPETLRLIERYKVIEKEVKPKASRDHNKQALGLAIQFVRDLSDDTQPLLEDIEGGTKIYMYFDTDIETDELIIRKVRLRVVGGQLYIWSVPEEGTEEDIETSETYEDAFLTKLDVKLSKEGTKNPIPSEIPSFPKLLLPKKPTAKDNKFRRDLVQHYSYQNGPRLDEGFYELGYDPFFTVLLGQWLQLHDWTYLQRMYDLQPVLRVQKLPFILRSDDEFLRYLADPIPDTRIRGFWTRKYDLQAAGVLAETLSEVTEEVSYILGPFFILITSTNLLAPKIFKYVKAKAKGETFFVDRNMYTNRSEAIEALYRLRKAASVPVVAGIAEEGAVSGVLAEILPRHTGFGVRKEVVPSYTYTEAETRWRRICESGMPTEAEVEELVGIAKGLDIKTRSRKSETLCNLISKQYEVEFGERARIRAAGEEEIPVVKSKKSPTSPSRTKSPKKSPKRASKYSK